MHGCPPLWHHHPILALSVFYTYRRHHVCLYSGPEMTFSNFYLSRKNICQKWRTVVDWSAPWCDCVYMNGWTWTQVHRIFECNKNSSRWREFEPVNSWCEAHFILWPLKPPPSLCPESRTSSSVLHEQFPLTFPNIHVEYMTHSSALTMKCP